jgi:peptidoglycan/LPS O-acetylase OafA/YrhL
MAHKDEKWYKTRAWMGVIFFFGVFLLAAGLYGLLIGPSGSGEGFANYAISMGFIMVLLAGTRLLRGESSFMQDERTRKIGAYGLSYSWFLTFLALFGVFWLDYFGVPLPDAGTLAVIFILLMGISARVFQSWLFRKGDVE